MSDRCSFCEIKKPTNHLVLNGGELWLEFCEDCGITEQLTNDKGDVTTVKELYDSSKE